MKFDYNSPEIKIARVALVLIGAALAIGWLVSQYSWASDIMNAPGLSALKFLFVLITFTGFALLVRTMWHAAFGQHSDTKHTLSYESLVAEALIIIVGIALYWATQAGWFGSQWAIYPI